MEPQTGDQPPAPLPTPPEELLDAFRDHPEWDDRQRIAQLERLIASHPPDRLRAAVRERLLDLSGADGEPIMRLVEALATPELLDELAEALLDQPGLAPERAWEALTLLDDAGLLAKHPDLVERWEELNEALDDEGSLEQLAVQIEEDPEGLWLALQGLAVVEPDIRAEIIQGLARLTPGPNLFEFLRLLSFAHDPATRAAALAGLDRTDRDDPQRAVAWTIIAADHPDPGVVERARQWLGRSVGGAIVRPESALPPVPRLVHSLVTSIDGQGQGMIVLSATLGTTRTSAAFLCDVRRGLADVFGQTAAASPVADAFLDEFAGQPDRETVLDAPGLAAGLLRGSLLLCGPETTPALRYWLERTLGRDVAPRQFPVPFPDWDPATLSADEMAERAELVLASCPNWIDTSPLTHDIAEEIALREGDSPPHPRRDAGAYRYLFEHQLRGQLELYRRMLFWMASFWQATGDDERGRSALALASQLSDEQYAVAGHPFTVALTTHSLAAAQANLRSGNDPRRRPERPRSP